MSDHPYDGGGEPDPLERLWGLFDLPEPVLSAAEALWWPAGTVDALVAAKLLAQGQAAGQVACPGCADRHVEEVTAARRPDGTVRYYIPCPDAGRAEVPADLLRQWRPDWGRLARTLKEQLGIVGGRATPHLPGRLWRLGSVRWPGGPREAYLARGLPWPDGASVAAEVPADARPLVFVGRHGPDPSVWAPAAAPPVLPLASVVHAGDGGRPELDPALVAVIVDGADRTAAAEGTAQKEWLGRRVRAIVERRLADGGRDDVIAALHTQGLSSRQIEEELLNRGLSGDHSTVARKVEKVVKAKPPRSSRSILRHPLSQPRDTSGKPMPQAQPEPDE